MSDTENIRVSKLHQPLIICNSPCAAYMHSVIDAISVDVWRLATLAIKEMTFGKCWFSNRRCVTWLSPIHPCPADISLCMAGGYILIQRFVPLTVSFFFLFRLAFLQPVNTIGRQLKFVFFLWRAQWTVAFARAPAQQKRKLTLEAFPQVIIYAQIYRGLLTVLLIDKVQSGSVAANKTRNSAMLQCISTYISGVELILSWK